MTLFKMSFYSEKALAEPLRLLMSYGGEHFEVIRVFFENWPVTEPSILIRFGPLPITKPLENQVNPSIALARLLGKHFNIAGKDNTENFHIDAMVDLIHDFINNLELAHYEHKPEVKEMKYQQILADVIPYYLDKLEEVAKANNGHLALGKLTWADFVFAGIAGYLSKMTRFDILKKKSALKDVVDNVYSIPRVKEWIDMKPVSE